MYSNNAPYPATAMPPIFFRAGSNVAQILKCPDALTAQEMQAIASMAVQSVVQVAVPGFGVSPLAGWFLTVAESAEGKDAVRSFLGQGIDRFRSVQDERYAHAAASYDMEMSVWRAKQAGLKRWVANQASKGEAVDEASDALQLHHEAKPVKPREPWLVMSSFDEKALIDNVANRSKYLYVDVSEGVAVMQRRSLRHAHQLIHLYSGEPIFSSRSSSRVHNVSVSGALATINLKIQPVHLANALTEDLDLLMGGGFLPRFMPAYPCSTRGTRFSSPYEVHDRTGIDEFSQRSFDVLSESKYFRGEGDEKVVAKLSDRALPNWFCLRNRIEGAMAPGAALFSISEFAGRLANSTLRMAATWQYFQHGTAEITAETFEAATEICIWHANEFLRMFSPDAQMPDIEQDVQMLYLFLHKWYWDKNVSTWNLTSLVPRAPRPMRNKARVTAALEGLAVLRKIRIQKTAIGETIYLITNAFPVQPELITQRPVIAA